MSEAEQHHHHHPAAGAANRIGKYQIVKNLGEGSFGKVKLAYHTGTGQRVALKMINRKTLSKSDMQGRIEREISYLRLLRHPHIIKLYDVIKSKDEIIMVIEYAGKELFDYIIQHGRMKEDEARRFFQQIIAAVDYCHRHKIVHRDLKPENLLLDDQLNVKIADFGLSNIMTDGNFLKTSCGSPNYAAPEVISGKLYAGPEVDVWSCGVILYVMLCGRLPFDDELIPALFKKISNGVYTLPHDLSPGAKNLLTKMLVVNPLNRITIKEIMEDEWFKVGLPEYLLKDVATEKKVSPDDVSEDVVNALAIAMGYSREEIIDAIKIGRTPETEEILDSYQLMKSNKKLVEDINKQDRLHTATNDPSHPRWRTPTNIDYPKPDNATNYNPSSTIAILPSSLPQIHRASMVQLRPELASIQPISTKKSKTRWHFGIRSRSYPLDVMGEIYRALKNLGAEWVRPSEEELWTIKVRWRYTVSDSEQDADLMKMQIQLFQLEPNNYLVDFKFDGWESKSPAKSGPAEQELQDSDEISSFSAYPFLHLATRLIMELAVNSQG
ncbi:hypothetical protein KL907_004449 [Ogataea polymorpha]|nr:hypothetical protein KL907_004449 [Ogataea polymorpha]